VLAATLSAAGRVPVARLVLGIDRFTSEAPALTNRIGNAVATVVAAKWRGELDEARTRRVLDCGTPDDTKEREKVLDTVGSNMPAGAS